jgi:hypothetical protein
MSLFIEEEFSRAEAIGYNLIEDSYNMLSHSLYHTHLSHVMHFLLGMNMSSCATGSDKKCSRVVLSCSLALSGMSEARCTPNPVPEEDPNAEFVSSASMILDAQVAS